MKCKFKIRGLDCANCAAELERALRKIEGIKNATISFMAERMELEYDENNEEEIIKKVKKVIKREEPDVTIEEIQEGVIMKKKAIKIIVAFILFLIALIINFNNAKSRDIIDLIELIKREVHKKFNVELQLEQIRVIW